jgi:hypothetical protein
VAKNIPDIMWKKKPPQGSSSRFAAQLQVRRHCRTSKKRKCVFPGKFKLTGLLAGMTEVLGVPVPDARTSPNQLWRYSMPGHFAASVSLPPYARNTKKKVLQEIFTSSVLPRNHTSESTRVLPVLYAGGALQVSRKDSNTVPTDRKPTLFQNVQGRPGSKKI